MIEEKAILENSNHSHIEQVPAQEQPSKTIARMAVIGLALIFLISLFYQPAKPRLDGSYFTICTFKIVTGLPCPGCGLTHSFCSIGKGDFNEAFAYNLLGPPLFLLALLIFLRSICVLVGWMRPALVFDRAASRARLLQILFAAFVAFGFGRILYIIFFRG